MKIGEESVNKLRNSYGGWIIYMHTDITNNDANLFHELLSGISIIGEWGRLSEDCK